MSSVKRLALITSFADIPPVYFPLFNDKLYEVVAFASLCDCYGSPSGSDVVEQSIDIYLATNLEGLDICNFDYIVIASEHYSQVKVSMLRLGVPHRKILPNFNVHVFYDQGITKCIEDRDRFVLHKKWSIVSNNCVGGTICEWLGIPFCSPFVGCWVEPFDFVKIMSCFERYVTSKLRFVKSKYNYPVGRLLDVHIYFNHYASVEDVVKAWIRRVERIDYKNLLFILSMQTLGDDKTTLKQFNAMSSVDKILICQEVMTSNNIVLPCLDLRTDHHDEYLDGVSAWSIFNRFYDVTSLFL